MPFDGRQPWLEIQIIDKALEVLGPNGERWIQGQDYRRGKRCLMGALNYARRKLGIKDDHTTSLIIHEIYGINDCPDRILFIETYNDQKGRTFDEIAALLIRARNLAGG